MHKNKIHSFRWKKKNMLQIFTLKLQSCILQTRQEHLQNFFRGGRVWGLLKVLGQHTKNRTLQGHSRGEGVFLSRTHVY